MRRLRKNPCNSRLPKTLFLALSLFIASTHLAQANCGMCEWPHWRPFITLGGGVAITSNLGKSKSFIDPASGGPDIYSASNASQTAGAFDGFFGMAWDFHPRWELQLGFGYNQTTSLASNGTLLQSIGTPSANSFSYTYNVVARQYLVESKLLCNLYDNYHPYIELGLGASQNGAYRFETNILPSSSAPTIAPAYPNQTNSSFSYNTGVGIDIDVLHNVRLGLGYRFINFGRVQLGSTIINTTTESHVLSQSTFYVNEALVQVTFIL